MKSTPSTPAPHAPLNRRTLMLSSAAALLLSACGGGGDDDPLGQPLANPEATSPWAAPLTLTANASLTASHLNVACNDAGDAMAVWQELSPGGTRRLLGRRYRVDVGWDPVHEIATTTDVHILEADVAIDAGGQAWVVWTQKIGSNHLTLAMRHLPLSGWQLTVQVNTSNDSPLTTLARVSVDAQGNALVGWISNRPSATPQVLVRPWLASVGWGAEVALNSAPVSDPRALVLALAPSGRAVVGWIEPAGNPSLWAARWSLTGGAEPDQQITSVGGVSDLSIAIDAEGIVQMAWRHVYAAANRVSTVRFASTGMPGMWATRDNAPPGDVGQVRIDAGAPGHFAVVWDEVLGSRRDAWGARIAPNDSATPPALLESDGEADAHHLQIALDSNNQARAAWLRGAGSQGQIWTARQPFNNAWDAPERIGNLTEDASSLHLKGSENGRALVAWLQPEGGVQRVWVQHRQPD